MEVISDTTMDYYEMRPVPGYDEQYWIDNYGGVYRKIGISTYRPVHVAYRRSSAKSPLRATVHLNITTSKRNRKQTTHSLHRLMALVFLGVPPKDNNHVVKHKNGLCADNRLCNLEVLDARLNYIRRYRAQRSHRVTQREVA